MVMELQHLEDFYANRVIFLTGASGFLGRITLEKLLRACPRIKKIYILLRGKKDKDCAKRMEEDIFKDVVFERLEKEQPDYRRKVSMIVGDCSLPNLGLRPEARNLVVQEVDVIIHWAATVRFGENLKVATNINVRAVRDLIFMAKEMPQLQSFLYVSTAFSNCIRRDIDEIYYDTPISGEGLINMMDSLDGKTVDEITKPLLGDWPNTYVFTKAVTESMIRDMGKGLPIGVIRPSIVLASYKEPVPGWIDNVYGATGILMGTAIGLIRIMQTNMNCVAEMIPADYVVNTAIAAVVDINYNHQQIKALPDSSVIRVEEQMPIYNVVSSSLKPIDWRTYMHLAAKHCKTVPSPKILWHSFLYFTQYYYLYIIGAFFLHIIPAYIFDFCCWCIGKKPRMVKGYEKIHKFSNVISYFSTREWKFHNYNVQKLYVKMQESDRTLYEFNVAKFDWDDYFYYYVRGGREYLLQDSLESVPQGKRKMHLLRALHYTLCFFLLFAFYKLIFAFLVSFKQF